MLIWGSGGAHRQLLRAFVTVLGWRCGQLPVSAGRFVTAAADESQR